MVEERYYKLSPPYLGMWFFLSFASIFSLLEFLYFQIPDSFLRDVIYHYCLTLPSAIIINNLQSGEIAVATHNMLSSRGVSLEVVRGCDGAGTLFLLIAAIVAFSASVKHKLFGLLAGVTLLLIINLVRIIGLYFVMIYNHQWFTSIHTFFAPTFIIIVGCLFFASWAQHTATSCK